MSDDTTNLEDQIPVPTLELWTLLKKFPLPETEDGAPAPGAERLYAAHAAASEWLAKVELELGCPSFENSADWAEFAPVKRQYGLCPKCERNDNYLMVGSTDDPEYWSLCHRHRVRWQLDPDVITDSFRVFGWDTWEDKFRPVWKYTVVKPIGVEDSATEEEPVRVSPSIVSPSSPNSAGPHLRLVHSQAEPYDEDDEDEEDDKDRKDDEDFGPSEPWPPPGGASLAERAFRLVCFAYFFAIIVPRELVIDALEYLSPDVT